MNQIYPDTGLVWSLQQVAAGGLHYHLYTNNLGPDLDTVLGDLTEAAWGGYAVVLVTGGSFTFTQVAAHIGSIQAPNITFTNSSGATVQTYGYFITDPTDAILVAAARFDLAPISIANGAALPVTPILGDYSGLSS